MVWYKLRDSAIKGAEILSASGCTTSRRLPSFRQSRFASNYIELGTQKGRVLDGEVDRRVRLENGGVLSSLSRIGSRVWCSISLLAILESAGNIRVSEGVVYQS